MIKKSIVPRMAGLFVGYSIIFFALVLLQFTKYGNFTKRISSLTVSAQYKEEGMESLNVISPGFDWLPITGRAVISFNGMEYRLTEENKCALVYTDGRREIKLPAYIASFSEEVLFRFSDGTVLTFALQNNMTGQELAIRVGFAEGTERLELPYKLLLTSRIQQAEDGRFFITYNGVRYGFSRTLMDPDKQILVLTNNDPFIAYQVIEPPSGEEQTPPENGEAPSFNPADFVIEGASEFADYNNAIEQWRTQTYEHWLSASDEAQIMAYISESIRRNNYSQVLKGAVPSSFANRAINVQQSTSGAGQKTYASSPYFGRTDQALRSLSMFERDANNRLSEEISSRSFDFFKESHAIEYLSLRGAASLVDAVAAWMRSIDPSSITPDCIPALLENYMDWETYRPAVENPFARFIERVYSLVSAGIRKNNQGDKVFVFNNGSADMLFNLRLGKALSLYAERTGNAGWAAAARSVILSVLSMTTSEGLVPKELLISDITTDTPASAESSVTIQSAYLYRELGIGENFPRALGIISGINTPIWTWTAATRVSANLTGTLGVSGSNLDIAVDFPSGESHYMLIRNIPPSITRLQLYNQTYRTAADFERWDSSGWVYSASEQTLLVKMKHRAQIEHIRIFW
ncbi:MAG: hypothetical protein LBP19_04525 [Treponema sp.]|nr:hypothetical protein [Treponema sp.]